MPRRLFPALSLLSVALWDVTAILWLTTSQAVRMWGAGPSGPVFGWACSGQGEINVGFETLRHAGRQGRANVQRWRLQQMQATEDERRLRAEGRLPPAVWLSSSISAHAAIRPDPIVSLTIPRWVLLVLLPAVPLTCRILRRRRFMKGTCRACGYNLTGNTSGVCTECGKPTAAGVRA
jgi:hypothetical protein